MGQDVWGGVRKPLFEHYEGVGVRCGRGQETLVRALWEWGWVVGGVKEEGRGMFVMMKPPVILSLAVAIEI